MNESGTPGGEKVTKKACPKCGAKNSSWVRFCLECSASMSAGPPSAVTQPSSGSRQLPEGSQRTSRLLDGVQPSADQPATGISQPPQTGEVADTPPQTERAEVKFEEMLNVIRTFEEQCGGDEVLWPTEMDVLFHVTLPNATNRFSKDLQNEQLKKEVVDIVKQLYDHTQRNLPRV